jgi:glycerate-2-kinase
MKLTIALMLVIGMVIGALVVIPLPDGSSILPDPVVVPATPIMVNDGVQAPPTKSRWLERHEARRRLLDSLAEVGKEVVTVHALFLANCNHKADCADQYSLADTCQCGYRDVRKAIGNIGHDVIMREINRKAE